MTLKRPFSSGEVLKTAESLAEKWRSARQERCRMQDLARRINERNRDLQVMQSIDTQLDAANRQTKSPRAPRTNTQIPQRHDLERDLQPAQLESQCIRVLVRSILHETRAQPHQLALELTGSTLPIEA